MKDLIKRIIIGGISGALLGYLLFLFSQGTMIVQGGFAEYLNTYYVILALVCLIIFVFFAVYPVHFRMNKATLFVFGIGLILISKTVLVNDAANKVYIGDLFSVIGVVLTLLAWTNVLITDKVRNAKANKKVEIIEV